MQKETDNGHHYVHCDFWCYLCKQLNHAAILSPLNDYLPSASPAWQFWEKSYQRYYQSQASPFDEVLAEWTILVWAFMRQADYSCQAPVALNRIFFYCCCRQSSGISFPSRQCTRHLLLMSWSEDLTVFLIYSWFFSFSFPWLVFTHRDFAENHVELLNYSTLKTCTELTVL